MTRKSHQLTTARRLQYPLNLVFVDTETTTISPTEQIHRPKLIFGHSQYIVLSPELDIIESHEFNFRKVFDFWTWFEKVQYGVKELTVFAHNWSFDYPVLDANKHMILMGYTLKSFVDASPPIILNYTRNHCTVRVLDSMNYYQSKLADMGSVIGAEKGEVSFNNRYSEALAKYCRRDVIILRESMIALYRYLQSNDLSRATHTISSLALSTYIRRFMKHKIYIDGDEERSEVGRKSYFGGRTEAFRIGNYRGPFYLIDVNSQYPFVMQTGLFPYRTVTTYKRVNIDDLIDVLGRFAVVAIVDIDTKVPAYPYKIDNRTCFPIGTFTTALSTPEINYAIRNDHITHVHQIVLYDHDRIFYDYVNFFYNQRIEHKRAGNDVWQLLDKYLMNTLYGKFGQTHKEWEQVDIPPIGTPHTQKIIDHDTGKAIYIMELNNQVFMSISSSEARDSFPAIAAHVTAGGRMIIQETIDYVGLEHVYYCDTDSLLLDQFGFDKMRDKLDDERLGAWAHEGTFNEIEIYGAKDYRFDQKERHKGVRQGAPQIEPGVYRQLQFATLRGCVISRDLSSPIIRNTTKHLKRLYKKGRVQPDGRVLPFVLSDGKLVSD
jgi:hypothetical protein